MEVGDIVIAVGCVSDRRGASEQAALVTHVWSDTDINCRLFIDGPTQDSIFEEHLLHESVQRTGKRFRLKGGGS